MPQPLSRVRSNAGISVGNVGDYPLQRHQVLAHLLAEAITSWSRVEGFLLSLFVELMGGHSDKAAAIFLALDIQSAKIKAINAAARIALTPKHKTLLDALLNVAKSQQKQRDRLAHGVWGDSPHIADALLLVDPRYLLHPSLIDADRIFVYRQADFVDIIRQNERLATFGLQFILLMKGIGPDGGASLYDRLCSEPEIRESLDRQAVPAQSQP